MTDNMTDLLKFQAELAEKIPDFKKIVDGAGILPPEELQELVDKVLENPEAIAVLSSLQGCSDSLAVSPSKALDAPTDPRASGLFQKEMGLPALNPLAEAALMERLQFDEDIPESRTGSLPEGGRPAVPVDTKVRNPVLLGAMLRGASDSTLKVITSNKEEARKALCKAQEEAGSALVLAETDLDHPDPEGYVRGSLPVPVKVSEDLPMVSEKEEREFAWAVRSTTQGRRSALQPIQGLIIERLRKNGFLVGPVDYQETRPSQEVLAVARWSMHLSSDKGAVQPKFAIIDVAARALAQHLLEECPDEVPAALGVEVRVSDRIADRDVGWVARLVDIR